LILTAIIKIVATRRRSLRPKCTKFDFSWDFASDTLGITARRKCKGFYF